MWDKYTVDNVGEGESTARRRSPGITSDGGDGGGE